MKIHQRSSLWFGKYDWCVRSHLQEACALRTLDHEYIDRVIETRRRWSMRPIGQPQPGSWHHAWVKNQISDATQAALHEFCDFLLSDTRPRKIMVMGDWISVYTTDRSLTESISALPFLDPALISLHHVRQQGTPGAVNLKRSKYSYRSYFKHCTLDAAQKHNITNFLGAQTDLRISAALAHFLKQPNNRRMLDYHFIDHHDQSLLIMLNLVAPGLIRRTIPIVAHK